MKVKKLFVYLSLIWTIGTIAQNKDSLPQKYGHIEKDKNLTLFQKKTYFDQFLLQTNNHSHLDKLAEKYDVLLKAFYRIKRYDLAIDCSLKIQSIGNRIQKKQIDLYVKNNKNLVNIYIKNQEYFKAIAAGNYFVKHHQNDSLRLGGVYRSLGNVYNDIGDFEKAISHYNKAIYLFQKLNNTKQEGKTLINVLEIYVKRKNEVYNNDALRVIGKLDSIQELKKADVYAKVLNTGAYYNFLNNLSEAKIHYKEALKIAEENQDSLSIFSCLVNLGTIERKVKNIDVSKTFFQKAKGFTLNRPDKKASLYNNLADTYKAEKDNMKALEFYNKAIKEISESNDGIIGLESLELNPYKIHLLRCLLDKTNFLIEINSEGEYLEEILEAYVLADKVVDMIYFESREDLSKLFWREQAAEMYVNATQIAFQRNDWEQVFYFTEKSKALLLLENVAESNAKNQANLSDTTIEREFQLKQKIRAAEAVFSSQKVRTTDKNILDSLRNAVFTQKQHFANFIDSLESTVPAYFKYKKKVKIFDAKETQVHLRKDEVVLQYKFTENIGYLTLVSSDDIQGYKLENVKVIHENIQALTNAIKKPFINAEEQVKYQQLAFQLYEQLFPFVDEDQEFLRNKKLIIIPEGKLHSLPFEALVVTNTEPLNQSYLLYTSAIRYAYSFSSLMGSSMNIQKFKKDFFAVQPSEFLNSSLPSLKLTSKETKTFETVLSTELLTHENATKKNFLQQYGSSKVVHLSTHGGVTENAPWIALHDQKLMLNDIYFQNRQPELVVLSACKTLEGEYRQGEGIMSVSRAFIKSGSRSVVSSLWDINQKASNELILDFYGNLNKGESTSTALRKAKLQYLEANKNTSQASPYYWSGLIFTGDDSIIIHQYAWVWWILGLVIVLLGLYVLQRKYRKKAA